MRATRNTVAVLAVLAVLAPAGAAAATGAEPAFDLQVAAAPSNFAPGDESGLDTYQIFLTNSGGQTTTHTGPEGEITIVDTLPPGVEVKGLDLYPSRTNQSLASVACETTTAGEVTTVTCRVTDAVLPAFEPAKLFPGNELRLKIQVAVPECPGAASSCPLTNTVEASGGGAAAAREELNHEASVESATAGFTSFRAEPTGADGKPAGPAASHPYAYTTAFAINTALAPPDAETPVVPAEGDIKEIEVALPPGLVGNPTAVARCTAQQFNTLHGGVSASGSSLALNECPDDSAVGLIALQQLEGRGYGTVMPIYNLVPPPGMPAQLGFQVFGLPVYINTGLRSDGDYGITTYLQNTPEAERISMARVTIWGDPADPSHDPLRGSCDELGSNTLTCPAGSIEAPFLRLPSFCEGQLPTSMAFDRWPVQGSLLTAVDTAPAPSACDQPPFEPSISAKPTTSTADAPSGLHFDLHLPQPQDAEGLGEADLRDTTVALPEGLVVNPSSADGLSACSLSGIGYRGTYEGHPAFSAEPPACPPSSKIGKVTVRTPLLDHPLPGAVYLAAQGENPFHSLLAIYIVVDDPQSGVVVKLPAEVSPDPNTGRLVTTVRQSPQVPFEDFELDFFEGPRAPLRTPVLCGTHTTTTTLLPWSAPAGPAAHPADSFQTTQPPSGGSCPGSASQLPSAPSFEAGTESPVAGATSPIVTRLSRADGSQEFSKLTLDPPPGLLARLAGVPYCPDSSLATAAARSGRDEQSSPSCPAASRVGTVTVGAGAGPAPYYTQGRAYLAGPYEGAPLSLAVVTPAVAGPFDLGAVVVRVALHVDPATTRITATTDEIPHILRGIPLDIRSIAVRLDHDGWGLNPTNCEPFSFDGELQSTLGQNAALRNGFQVGECARLAFKPSLFLRLKGKTKRGGFPALRALYRPRAADANLHSMVLRFPHSEFIEQGHFRTICTRVQWAAGAGHGTSCPRGSVYGSIRAFTPLLDRPLEGPVYLRSSSHELPDVVFALRGQVDAEVAVRVDSAKGGLRASIESAPDVPVSRVILTMQGGKKGLFVNSRDICARTYRAGASLAAQNGRSASLRPVLKAKCGRGHKERRLGHRRRR